MRAVRMPSPRTMQIVELPDPVCGSGEALIRLTEVAVCGSDLVPYLGTQPFTYPLPDGQPAHECVGIVEESDIPGYEAGDRVLYFPSGANALRERAVATRPDQLLKLPVEGDIAHWLLAQLLGTVIHSAKLLGSVMGQRIAVIGQGPVGQLFNALLWNLGAKQIVGIDRVADRLGVSRSMGATDTLLNDGGDVAKQLSAILGRDGADIVIEAAGYSDAHRLMFDLVRQDGRILMFGHPKPLDSEVPVYEWYKKRAHVITSWGPDIEEDIGLALQYIREGRINVKPIITHRFPLDRVQEAYELFAERKDGCVKVIVQLD